MRPDAGFLGEIHEPQDVRVERPRLHRQGGGVGALGRHEQAFVAEGTVVAVGQALGVHADDLAPVVHEIHAVALYRGRRRHAGLRPVVVDVLLAFRDDRLPQQRAGLLVEAHEDSAIALVPRIARLLVVRADVDAPSGNDRGGIRLRSQRRRPEHVAARLRIKEIRQPAFGGNLVARPRLPPLRLIRGKEGEGKHNRRTRGDGRQTGGRSGHGRSLVACPESGQTKAP